MNALTKNGGGPDDNAAQAGHPVPVCATGVTTHALTNEGHDASEDGTGRGTPTVVVVSRMPTTNHGGWRIGAEEAAGGALQTQHGGVRRLTPRECERLQGLPDDWTLIDWKGNPAADSRRYAACGDAVTVPVAEWIGGRLLSEDRAA